MKVGSVQSQVMLFAAQLGEETVVEQVSRQAGGLLCADAKAAKAAARRMAARMLAVSV